jgi:hypothetical protein
MPSASSRGLRSDAPSSTQIIVQLPASFKRLPLLWSALISRFGPPVATPGQSSRARRLFPAHRDHIGTSAFPPRG